MNGMTCWQLITRFGDGQALWLPTLLVLAGLWRSPETRSVAWRWAWLLCAAALLTTASKVAFMGWRIGWPALHFSGLSGHSMCAAAFYPMLVAAVTPHVASSSRRLAVAAGCAFALAVGASRVALDAHSPSEVLAGLLVGAMASAFANDLLRMPRIALDPMILLSPALLLVLVVSPMPIGRTDMGIARLSSIVSGRTATYTRCDLVATGRFRACARP